MSPITFEIIFFLKKNNNLWDTVDILVRANDNRISKDQETKCKSKDAGGAYSLLQNWMQRGASMVMTMIVVRLLHSRNRRSVRARSRSQEKARIKPNKISSGIC